MADFFFYRNLFKKGFYKIINFTLYSWQFARLGINSKIVNPMQIKNARFISIGNNVTINDQVFMMAEAYDSSNEVRLLIGNGCTIGYFNHIVAINKVIIGNNVLTADKVYISDNYHDYTSLDLPIKKQPVKSKRETIIGDECWIGENVSIISSKVGKHCVVAANSVVINDIPDYCVVAGAPAVVKKQYNLELGKWISVKEL